MYTKLKHIFLNLQADLTSGVGTNIEERIKGDS